MDRWQQCTLHLFNDKQISLAFIALVMFSNFVIINFFIYFNVKIHVCNFTCFGNSQWHSPDLTARQLIRGHLEVTVKCSV